MNEEEILQERKTNRNFVSCKYQRVCWKTVRAPLIKKINAERAAEGNRTKIFLPYLCSYQTSGDIEKCGIRDRFIEEEGESVNESI